MKKIAIGTIQATAFVSAALLFNPLAAQAAGATGPHAVILICSAIGSAGTNLLTLFVQGISSDDPAALAAVGPVTQPPPGVECGDALARVMSICGNPKGKGGCGPAAGGGGASSSANYGIQSVVPLENSLVYTLTAP